MNKLDAREKYLMNIVNATGQISTSEAVELLGVSEATVRRLFSKLESEGKVLRNYGGIQLSMGAGFSYSFDLREKCNQQEKVRIGQLAASLVEDGDTIYLDCGTTVLEMTRELGMRIANGEFTSLNIVTNSLANLQVIPSINSCCVVLVGGRYHHERRDFSGSLTERFVTPFHFTKCFLGCEGIHTTGGYFSNQLDISDLNNVVIKHSDLTAVLADSSKFNRSSMISYASLEDADIIVADKKPDSVLLRAIEERGIKIMTPEKTD